MRKFALTVAGTAAALSLAVAPARAQAVLYWTDFNVGTSIIPGAMSALTLLRPTTTATAATSNSNFATLMGSSTWDLVIFGQQNTGIDGGVLSALTTYLTGGGLVLGANWLGGNGFDALMGVAPVSSNGSSISGSGVMFAGIGGTVSLTNPGWGTFSRGYTGSGACLATLSSGGCAAQVGNAGRSMMISPLFDTYSSSSDGSNFVANGADYLLGGRTSPVPEPSTWVLMGTGLMAVMGVSRRRRQA